MKIDLHIERLVLEGLPVGSSGGAAIGAAVESELVRLLTAQGLPGAFSRAEPYLRANQLHLLPDRGPASVGQQISLALYSAVNSSEQPDKPPEIPNAQIKTTL